MDPGTRPDGEELAAVQEQLAEAHTEVERLQSEAANAVAEAAFLRDDVRSSREAVTAAGERGGGAAPVFGNPQPARSPAAAMAASVAVVFIPPV